MGQTEAFPTASAIKELTDLAASARGITIETIVDPDAFGHGRPAAIPIGISHGATPSVVDLSKYFESYRAWPARKIGTADALTLQSFIDLVNRHKTEHSAIFADTNWKKPGFKAVIDYHQLNSAPTPLPPADENADELMADTGLLGLPDYGRHRVNYDFPLSEEWETWVEGNGEPMTQLEFATFLEDRIAELSTPTEEERSYLERDFSTTVAAPSQLIQLSRGLQVNIDSKVKNIQTLQTGEAQIAFEESHLDSEGKPLKIPGIFILSVAPFFMGAQIRIPVRLRYRVKAGMVVWFYQMYRPDQHVTDRVRADLQRAGADTGLPAYEGKPEMSGT